MSISQSIIFIQIPFQTLGNVPRAIDFIRNGRSVYTNHNNQWSELHEASRTGNFNEVQNLNSKFVKNDSFYFQLGNIRIVNTLIRNGANVNHKDENGLSPLDVAAMNGNF